MRTHNLSAEEIHDTQASEPDVRTRLLAAATRLFAQKGFERTSVQEVVVAAGVTKGAMYHYFTSKDELLYAIYARVLAEQMSRLLAFVAAPGSAPERLREAARDVVVTTIANLDDSKVFFGSLKHLSQERQALVRGDRRRYHQAFRSLVEEGQRSSEFRSDLSADVVVNYFLGAVHHIGQWYSDSRPPGMAAVADSFADMLLASLVPS